MDVERRSDIDHSRVNDVVNVWRHASVANEYRHIKISRISAFGNLLKDQKHKLLKILY